MRGNLPSTIIDTNEHKRKSKLLSIAENPKIQTYSC